MSDKNYIAKFLAMMEKSKEISCSDLHTELGGYTIDRGLYDHAEEYLKTHGWQYNINIDAWEKNE